MTTQDEAAKKAAEEAKEKAAAEKAEKAKAAAEKAAAGSAPKLQVGELVGLNVLTGDGIKTVPARVTRIGKAGCIECEAFDSAGKPYDWGQLVLPVNGPRVPNTYQALQPSTVMERALASEK